MKPEVPAVASPSDPEWLEELESLTHGRAAARAVENGECGAQLEIEDEELRRSMIRNVAVAIKSACEEAVAAEREQIAKWHEDEGRYIRANAAEWPESLLRSGEMMRARLHRESAAAIRSRSQAGGR